MAVAGLQTEPDGGTARTPATAYEVFWRKTMTKNNQIPTLTDILAAQTEAFASATQ